MEFDQVDSEAIEKVEIEYGVLRDSLESLEDIAKSITLDEGICRGHVSAYNALTDSEVLGLESIAVGYFTNAPSLNGMEIGLEGIMGGTYDVIGKLIKGLTKIIAAIMKFLFKPIGWLLSKKGLTSTEKKVEEALKSVNKDKDAKQGIDETIANAKEEAKEKPEEVRMISELQAAVDPKYWKRSDAVFAAIHDALTYLTSVYAGTLATVFEKAMTEEITEGNVDDVVVNLKKGIENNIVIGTEESDKWRKKFILAITTMLHPYDRFTKDEFNEPGSSVKLLEIIVQMTQNKVELYDTVENSDDVVTILETFTEVKGIDKALDKITSDFKTLEANAESFEKELMKDMKSKISKYPDPVKSKLTAALNDAINRSSAQTKMALTDIRSLTQIGLHLVNAIRKQAEEGVRLVAFTDKNLAGIRRELEYQ